MLPRMTPGQPRDDALVIPLCPAHHNEGAEAIHRDVLAWERAHGSQIEHMLHLYSQLPIETAIACRVFGRLEEIAHRLVV